MLLWSEHVPHVKSTRVTKARRNDRRRMLRSLQAPRHCNSVFRNLIRLLDLSWAGCEVLARRWYGTTRVGRRSGLARIPRYGLRIEIRTRSGYRCNGLESNSVIRQEGASKDRTL